MKGIFTQMNQHDQQESDLPTRLASPARRALVGAGYVRLEQFTQLSEAEVLQLHGMGPKAVDQLRRALADRGLSFAERKKSQAKDEG
jgi:DNA-directed RNA polymerase alpha subunit